MIVSKARPRRVTGDVIDEAIARLNLQPAARIPDLTATEPDVSRVPIAIAAPDSALAYEQLVEHLAGWAVVA